MRRIYVGKRTGSSTLVTIFEPKCRPYYIEPDPAYEKEITCFDWGRASKGALFLAQALLMDYLRGKEDSGHLAMLLREDFMYAVVTRLQPSWRLTTDEVGAFVSDALLSRKAQSDSVASQVEITIAGERDQQSCSNQA